MGRPLIDLTGRKFGYLTVISKSDKADKYSAVYWNCRCVCGGEKVIRGAKLKSGDHKSCGCKKKDLLREVGRKHLMCHTSTYHTWEGMKQRCLNSKDKKYKSYGGRGIKLCVRWFDFKNFFQDMGNKPDGMSIDRINVNGNYEPSNCRWATPKEQANNRRITKKITYKGKTLSISEWADEMGVSYSKIYNRFHKGLSPDEILKI